MDRFYGQLLRNRFPQLSRIRRDDGSTGAKILDCIGNEISNSRSKIFSSSVRVSSSSEFPEAGREKFFYKKIENLNYISNLRNSTIESINCSDPSLTEASSEEEIYASEEENLRSESSKNYTIQKRVICEFKSGTDESFEVGIPKARRVYIDIQKFENVNQNIERENVYICLRGLDQNLNPIEEHVDIHDVGLYSSRKKFRTIEPIYADIEKGIIGGRGVEIAGADNLEGEILSIPVQSWNDTKKYFYESLVDELDSVDIKKKRIKINNLLSVVSLEKNFLNIDSLRDNELYIEIFKTESKSFIRYIHSYIFHAQDSKNKENMLSIKKEDEEFFFETEEILLEQELLSNSGESIVITDFTYDDITNTLITIEDDLSIKVFRLGKSKVGNDVQGDFNRVKRTRLKELKLEATQQRILKDTFNYYKVLCFNNIKPIKNFFIARYLPSSQGINDVEFYDRVIGSWRSHITLNSGIFGAVDDLDSISIFNFVDVLNESGEYCYYIFSYQDPRIIKDLVEEYNQRIRREDNTSDIEDRNFQEIHSLFHSDKNNYFIEELKIIVESNSAVREFNEYKDPNNIGYDGVFFDKYSKNLFISNNTSIECLKLYNKKYFIKDNIIYSTEPLDGTTFTITFENNAEVVV